MRDDQSVPTPASGGSTPDADIISAWQADFEQHKRSSGVAAVVSLFPPTGKPIKAIRMPLVVLMQSKSIPDRLSHIVSGFIDAIESGQGEGLATQAKLEGLFAADQLKTAQSWLDLLNFVWLNCVVTPSFVEEQHDAKPDEGIFWVGMVNFYDKLWLFEWAQGVDRSIQEFLHEQIDLVGTLPDGQGVRPTTEQFLTQGDFGNFLVRVADRPSGLDVGPLHSGQDRRPDRSSGEHEEEGDAANLEVQTGTDHGDADRPHRVVPASADASAQ